MVQTKTDIQKIIVPRAFIPWPHVLWSSCQPHCSDECRFITYCVLSGAQQRRCLGNDVSISFAHHANRIKAVHLSHRSNKMLQFSSFPHIPRQNTKCGSLCSLRSSDDLLKV